MPLGATGYFERYPADPNEILGIAAQMRSAATSYDGSAEDVRAAGGRATDAVDGDLDFPMTAGPHPAINQAKDLEGGTRFAAGVLLYFTNAVITFNTGVDGLNQRYDALPPEQKMGMCTPGQPQRRSGRAGRTAPRLRTAHADASNATSASSRSTTSTCARSTIASRTASAPSVDLHARPPRPAKPHATATKAANGCTASADCSTTSPP